jgi:RND family efflux transporter MFP subunit
MDRVGLATILLVPCVALSGCREGRQTQASAERPVVVVEHPVISQVSDYEDFTGFTDAVFNVEVRARVTGYLIKKHFQDGADVRKGDMLFEIDPRPYEAELERAEATLTQNEARLKRLDADLGRARSLRARDNISREEYDRTVGDHAEAEASVEVARAGRDLAKLNVEFTKVRSPISGRLSRGLLSVGNVVNADVTPLVTIVSVDPIHVYFDIDERTLLRLRRLVREGKIRSRQEAEVPVLAGFSDENGFPHVGKINFSENRLDASTGTLRVRGVIANPGPRAVVPGTFVKIRLPLGSPHEETLVPEQALESDGGKRFVYVVDEKNEVGLRPVKVGLLRDGMRVILEGFSQGERVIIAGRQRVRPGVKVRTRPPKESTLATVPSHGPPGRSLAP